MTGHKYIGHQRTQQYQAITFLLLFFQSLHCIAPSLPEVPTSQNWFVVWRFKSLAATQFRFCCKVYEAICSSSVLK
jgi:hypothetical protein